MPASVNCPVCSAAVPWVEASRWRPFCSERCKLIDLGDWAADRHVIPGDPAASADDSETSANADEHPRRS